MSELSSRKRAIDGIRAAIVSQCNEALKNLSGRTVSPENIHTARKAVKKARAWLRLLRSGMSARAFRGHNHALRDAARPLSEGRDAQVLIETLHELLEHYGEPARDRRFGGFEKSLQKSRRAIRRRVLSSRTGIASSRSSLRRSTKALSEQSIKGKDWDVIGAGFEKVYARGRASMRVARHTSSPELLHEWRKDTKNLWHQLQMLEPLWPGVIGEWADQAHQLADYLGDDHDLAVLRDAVTKHSHTFTERTDSDALLALIDRQRAHLQDKARLLGARLYEPKPRRLHARLEKYWQLWIEARRAAL
jgi:CHAD domain-containing protein